MNTENMPSNTQNDDVPANLQTTIKPLYTKPVLHILPTSETEDTLSLDGGDGPAFS